MAEKLRKRLQPEVVAPSATRHGLATRVDTPLLLVLVGRIVAALEAVAGRVAVDVHRVVRAVVRLAVEIRRGSANRSVTRMQLSRAGVESQRRAGLLPATTRKRAVVQGTWALHDEPHHGVGATDTNPFA